MMLETAHDFGYQLTVENNKIVLNNEKDLNNIIDLLDDKLLKSPQTGKKYKANSKKQITP
jgi:hypothetical protein